MTSVYYGKYIGYYANCFQGPWPKPSLDESQRDLVPAEAGRSSTSRHTEARLPLVVAARVGRLWGLFKPGQTTALDWWLEGRGRAAELDRALLLLRAPAVRDRRAWW